jgi:hypothetical protein
MPHRLRENRSLCRFERVTLACFAKPDPVIMKVFEPIGQGDLYDFTREKAAQSGADREEASGRGRDAQLTLPIAANVTVGDIYYMTNANAGGTLVCAVRATGDFIQNLNVAIDKTSIQNNTYYGGGVLKLGAISNDGTNVNWIVLENIGFS